ncbi:YPL176C [Saccharomyces arboricola H-6]|uniref:YPL176C n=1 Tax=Saccharomyces arboricola (strain H-6 / AS 2.3317 / CBS 10644) TaxID=1160507 RepID=J8PVJ3_SACAR|nr:YPL176C [Saccharomyces arboricola H-6]
MVNTRGYTAVPRVEVATNNLQDELNSPVFESDMGMPSQPPVYVEEMSIEEPQILENFSEKVQRFRLCFENNVVIPVKEKVVDPLAQVICLVSEKFDLLLSKLGNVMVMKRIFYILLMSIITVLIISSDKLPNGKARGSNGSFSDHDLLLQYARKSIDLSKIERDLEYISSMPHMSGTSGDAAIRHYIKESFDKNGIKIAGEEEFMAYSNYPGNASLHVYPKGSTEGFDIPLNEENFNPMSPNGEFKNISVIYGHTASPDDMVSLRNNGVLKGGFILLLHYGDYVFQQMMTAQEYGAKAVIFISEPYKDNKDVVQMKSVAQPQSGTGDALAPEWEGSIREPLDALEAEYLPKIPSIPISYNQGEKILAKVSDTGVKFSNNIFSGTGNDCRLDLLVQTAIRERHPVHDIVGKIEGSEQAAKAIVISAPRNSISYGAMYPSFGTAILLSLVELYQEMVYKFDWKPLRNIYFISFGGSEFNEAGATELMEKRSEVLKSEIYTIMDVGQIGIWDDSNVLDIQCHPLLADLFQKNGTSHKLDLKVSNVHQFGDWTPYLARGMPIAIISSPNVMNRGLPIGTTEDKFDAIKNTLRDKKKGEMLSEIMLYLVEKSLELIDDPFIPFNVSTYVDFLSDTLKTLQRECPDTISLDKAFSGTALWKSIEVQFQNWKSGWNDLIYGSATSIEPTIIAINRWTWNYLLSRIGITQCYEEGLAERPFYKNIIFGPRLKIEKDYPNRSWTLPEIRDYIANKNWNSVQAELDNLGTILLDSARYFLQNKNLHEINTSEF